jgi:hypothetical protein
MALRIRLCIGEHAHHPARPSVPSALSGCPWQGIEHFVQRIDHRASRIAAPITAVPYAAKPDGFHTGCVGALDVRAVCLSDMGDRRWYGAAELIHDRLRALGARLVLAGPLQEYPRPNELSYRASLDVVTEDASRATANVGDQAVCKISFMKCTADRRGRRNWLDGGSSRAADEFCKVYRRSWAWAGRLAKARRSELRSRTRRKVALRAPSLHTENMHRVVRGRDCRWIGVDERVGGVELSIAKLVCRRFDQQLARQTQGNWSCRAETFVHRAVVRIGDRAGTVLTGRPCSS